MKLYIVDLLGTGLIEKVEAVKVSQKTYWIEVPGVFGGASRSVKRSLETQYDKAFKTLDEAVSCLLENRRVKVEQAKNRLNGAEKNLARANELAKMIEDKK
jgi:hypothetical protein